MPPMPLSPASRSGSTHYTQRSSRVPRKIPAAYQIFADGPEDGVTNTKRNSLATSMASMAASAPSHSQTVNERSRSVLVVPEIVTPSRQRRATVSDTMDQVNESPLSRKEKSKSQGDLFQRRIAPLAKLELELERKSLTFGGSDCDRLSRLSRPEASPAQSIHLPSPSTSGSFADFPSGPAV